MQGSAEPLGLLPDRLQTNDSLAAIATSLPKVNTCAYKHFQV
jgi:hypothetical protein